MTTDVLGNKIELVDYQQQPIILQEELDNNEKIEQFKVNYTFFSENYYK